MPGYSQSMLIPSNRPAITPWPPDCGGQIVAGSFGRLPRMNRSRHDCTNAFRDALVRIRRIIGDAVDALRAAPGRRFVARPLVAEDAAAGRRRERKGVVDVV